MLLTFLQYARLIRIREMNVSVCEACGLCSTTIFNDTRVRRTHLSFTLQGLVISITQITRER